MTAIQLAPLKLSDIDEIVIAFEAIGWHKPRNLFEKYLDDQSNGDRAVIVAYENKRFCGYVTIQWISDYSDFKENHIPEIVDLNVLPHHQQNGIGTKLIRECEKIVTKKGYNKIGLGVGLLKDYGKAQKLYIKLGYIPDGNGIHSHHQALHYHDTAVVDDDLVLYFIKSLPDDNHFTLNLPNQIETPRLLIRAPKSSDASILNTAIIESFDELHQFMPWAKEKPTPNESLEVVKRDTAAWLENKKADGKLTLLIFDRYTNDFIGATGFLHIQWDVPCAETGYWIRSKYAKRGYMTEAINALTRYGFHELHLKRLAITCDPDNIQSKKIPERLGYQFESLMKCNHIKPNTNEVTDTLVFVRTDAHDLPELTVTWK